MNKKVKTKIPEYGVVRNPEELGRLTREHRKSRGIPLETVSGLGNLGLRFLSEFERGKETAEIGKVLKALSTLGLEVIIQPRRIHQVEAHLKAGNASLTGSGQVIRKDKTEDAGE